MWHNFPNLLMKGLTPDTRIYIAKVSPTFVMTLQIASFLIIGVAPLQSWCLLLNTMKEKVIR